MIGLNKKFSLTAVAAWMLVLGACGDKTVKVPESKPTAAPTVTSAVPSDAQLVIYTSRAEQLIKPITDAYEKETGIKVAFVSDKEGPLMERLTAEGTNTPADVFMTVDAGNLWQASQKGLLQPVESAQLVSNIPAHLRDPKNEWFGFSVRARTIFFNKEKVKPEQLSTYEDLASDKWKGKLCLRSSKKVYNQSLIASLISKNGTENTEKMLKGWVNNLAAPEFPDDTKLLEAIAAGQCEVGIANTYYYGRLVEKDPKLNVGLFWADQKTSGTHVNVSGAGVTKNAKHKDQAVKFLEWLSSEKAQSMFADANLEFPANSKIKPAELVASWGAFKQDTFNVATMGEGQAQAIKLMDAAGYK